MSYDLKKYYLSKSGLSSIKNDTWHIDDNMNYSFKIYGDNEVIKDDKIIIAPSIQKELNDNIFSNKEGQVFDKTKIIESSNGERVELDLEKRIVTFIVDQSGSMTWNDNKGIRHDIISGLVDKMSDNYGGEVYYNLVEYGGEKINVMLFGILEDELERFDYRTITELMGSNEDSYFSGIRIVRKKNEYASSYAGIDGEILKDGFFSAITDTELDEGENYFYTIYTYNREQNKFSSGKNIKVSPRDREIPIGVSSFKTIIDAERIDQGYPLIGIGVNRDDNTIGIWHFDEGEGNIAFDFSNNKCNLIHSRNNPYWLNKRFTPSGISGLLFDGESDHLSFDDIDNNLHISFDEDDNKINISAWVFPYRLNGIQNILSRGEGSDINYSLFLDDNILCININGDVSSSGLSLDLHKWQYVSFSYDGDDVLFNVNDSSYTDSLTVNNILNPSELINPKLFVGCSLLNSNFFQGLITEVSLHNINRSSEWVNSQIYKNGDDFYGRKEDNGDRLVVFRYGIPSDFNFQNGKVRIVKNKNHMPSWEEDGEIIYDEDALFGFHFVTDADDFYIGKKYFYKIFSKNELGNYCFSEDAYGISVDIPIPSTDKYFIEDNIEFDTNNFPDVRIANGNKKNCFFWESDFDGLKRVKIYYNLSTFPISHDNSVSGGNLIFDGWVEDQFYIHRGLENNQDYFYRIVFLDRYERIIYSTTKYSVPSLSANEDEFPLEDVKNVMYEIIDESSVGIKWVLPDKDPEDVSAYFDQTIVLFGSITNEYGEPIPDESPLDFSITANINREKEVEDVFDDRAVEFKDSDSYRFNVSRSRNGIIKATLSMTSNTNIISKIKEADFKIQIKSEIKRVDTGISRSEDVGELNPFRDYVRVIEGLIGDIEGAETRRDKSNDIFSFFSKSINIKFKNPWHIEIVNRDNKRVHETCYYTSMNRLVIPPRQQLSQRNIFYNGIHMRSSSPFVARVKVEYKGEPVDSGFIRLSVWDATMDGLCTCAYDGSPPDCKWEGKNIRISETVMLQSPVLDVQRGVEINSEGIERDISYVDVPIQSTDRPHAINLYAKSERAGYSSIDKMYILFQNILRVDLVAPSTIRVGNRRPSELSANCFVIHPDYPNMNNDFHKSRVTLVEDGVVAKWSVDLLEGDVERNIYSIDNVPLSDGVYSYIRNGVAKNVFFEPVESENREIDEIHIVKVEVSYRDLFAESQRQLSIRYSPQELIVYNPRFLMERHSDPATQTWLRNYIDGNPIWADGKDYVKIKIHRNPNTDDDSIDEFSSSSYFISCSNKNGLPIFELSYGQLIRLFTSDDVEIIYGDVEEDIEHETGDKYLKINEDGFVGKGDTSIFLDRENEITYFYLRINKLVDMYFSDCESPDENPYFCEEIINECMGLERKESYGREPTISVEGETDIFVDGGPVILRKHSSFDFGWPPIQIAILEPLSVSTMERIVKVPTIFNGEDTYIPYESNRDNFFIRDSEDNRYKNFIFYGSVVEAKIRVSWRGRPVPDNTPVYVRVGENNEREFFISEQNIYYTETNLEENYSFVTVVIRPRISVSSTGYENIYIYTLYDERGDIQREKGVTYNLRLDPIEFALDIVPPPVVPPTDDIVVPIKPPSLYLSNVYRYSIENNEWEDAQSMKESRGNAFCGVIDNNIFVSGGLNNENISISKTVERYDPYDNMWSYFDNSGFTPRFSGMSISYNDQIFMIGGVEGDIIEGQFNLSNKMESLCVDSSGWSWETLSSIPDTIAFASSCLVEINGNKYIYVIGGVNDASISVQNQRFNNYSNAIHRYDISNNSWDSFYIASPFILNTYQRVSPLCIVHEEEILVFNGAIEESNMFFYPSNGFSITLEENIQDTFIKMGNSYMAGFPEPRFQSSMSYDYEDSYYILGGGNNISSSIDLVEKITIDNSNIIYKSSEDDNSDILSKMPMPMHGISSAFINSVYDSSLDLAPYIYVMGGYKTTFLRNDIDISIEI